MNVLVISHMYPNECNPNSGLFIQKQVNELKNVYGSDVNIKLISPIPYAPGILTLFSSRYKKYNKNPKKISNNGIEVYYTRAILLPKNLNFKSSGKALYRSMKKLIHELYKDFKFDIIHAHVALPDGECALKLGEEYGKPVITTVHGQDINYTINLGEEYKRKVITVMEKSNATVFVSEKLKREASSIAKASSNFYVIPNGINRCDIKQNRVEEIDKELENCPYILVVGNLIKTKGINYAIEAFSRLHPKYPNLKLMIIGDGGERENLKNLCKSNKVESSVIFKGLLENNKVMEYMKNCLFFALPSYKEGFGVVYIEAMAHGKAVIGCKGEGIADVIENFKDGILVNPKDSYDLEKNMQLLIENDELRHKIEVNAEEKVLNNYTWQNNANLNYKLYNKIMSNK